MSIYLKAVLLLCLLMDIALPLSLLMELTTTVAANTVLKVVVEY
jgi:hypothetical protein